VTRPPNLRRLEIWFSPKISSLHLHLPSPPLNAARRGDGKKPDAGGEREGDARGERDRPDLLAPVRTADRKREAPMRTADRKRERLRETEGNGKLRRKGDSSRRPSISPELQSAVSLSVSGTLSPVADPLSTNLECSPLPFFFFFFFFENNSSLISAFKRRKREYIYIYTHTMW
jgi:hypothetical protein